MMTERVFAATVVLLAGCYAPDVRDCTITCGAADECADDQVCNADGYCAADGVQCPRGGGGGGGAVDGGVDAPVGSLQLNVRVDGTGRLDIDGVGECAKRECTFTVERRPLTIRAVETDPRKPFEKWTTPNCAGQPTTCTYQPQMGMTTVGAKFK